MKSTLFCLLLLSFSSSIVFGDSTKTCIGFTGEGDFIFERPPLLNQIETTHFIVHWEGPTTQSYAENTASYSEYAYQRECVEMNWSVPPPDDNRGGNNKYDIYLVDEDYIDGSRGVTQPEVIGNWTEEWAPSFILVSNELPSDNDLKMVLAHEFNHASQLSYTYKDGESDTWFYENTAVWAAEIVYNYQFKYYLRYGSGPLLSPEYGIHTAAWGIGNYNYAGFLWPKFLSEWQDDNDIIRKIWERMGTIPGENILNDIDTILTTQYQSNLDEAVRFYADWRFFTGDRDDGLHFQNAGIEYLPTSTAITYTTNITNQSTVLYGFGGTRFIVFDYHNNFEITEVTFNGNDSYPWIAAVIQHHPTTLIPCPNILIELNSSNDGSIDVPNYDLAEWVTVVLTPILNEDSDVRLNVNCYYSGKGYEGDQVFFYNKNINGDNKGGYLRLDGNSSNDIESGGFRWVRVSPPDHNIETLDERFVGTQVDKHHHWNSNLNQYFLNKDFSVQNPGNNDQTARFNKINYCKIEARLEGFLFDQKGEFQFQDPWYVQNDGTQGGTDYWIDCVEFYEPTGKEGASEKGVFLAQEILSTNPYYSAKTTSPQDIPLGGSLGTRAFYFLGWNGTDVSFEFPSYLQTGVVFEDVDALVQGKFKGHLLSNDQNGFSNGTQRRLVRTDNGIYHLVYESMGSAWYTHSLTTDFNGEWSEEGHIGNKNPSIDYYGNDIKIVCETYTLDLQNGVIVLWELTPTNDYSLEYGYSYSNNFPFTYYGYAKPVIANNNGGKIFIAYRRDLTHGIYLLYKLFSPNWVEVEIEGTNYSSLNPSIAGFYNTVNIAYEQEGSIVYQKISYTNQLDFDITETISSGDGFQNNYSPSISLAGLVPYDNGCPVVSWIGDNGPGIGKINGENGGEENTINVVIRRGSNDGRTWGAFEKVGDNVVSANNNSITSSTEKTVITWSEFSGSNYYGKWIRRVNDSYINTQPLSNNGKQNQVSNGTDLTNIGSTALLVNTTPFDVNMSTTDFNQDFGPGGGGTGKISNNIELSYGRQGVIYKNGIEFLFNIGDVIVGDSVVKFINHPDTLTYASADDLNEVVRTEPFNLSSSTEFYFTDFYYVMNPEAADSSLTETDMVNFKAELVNAQTGAIVGTFDDITYSIQQLEKYNNISYQVNCSNIVEGDYYLRLVTTVAGEADYYLCNVQNDGENLSKRNYNKINFDGTEIPVSYELSQNYPNPFNPSTSIKFQIPESGAVTLKIYDILGREVTTLVDEFKTEGRYEVNFNASSLASGVYLYRIEVKSSVPDKKGFTDVKKMILLK